MLFISTRGGKGVKGSEAILRGIAEGGGLYVPETFPTVTKEEFSAMLEMDYPERAAFILGKFLDEFAGEELLTALRNAYGQFTSGDPVPLVKVEGGLFILELFHGPSCGSADIGSTLLPYLVEKSRAFAGVKENILVLTASRGGVAKALMEAFRDKKGVKVAVFYPDDGVSKMQKIQLCVQDGENLTSVAVRGCFDDCQAAVKKILRSQEQRDKLKEKGYALTTGSSTNVGQLLSKVACFFSAYLDLVSSEQLEMGGLADFALPAGNFGSVLAVYYAKKMGLPVGKIVSASNRNNVTAEFLNKGTLDRKKPLYRTMSPELDVLNASGLERLIFELSGRDAALTVERMKALAGTGKYSLRAEELKELQKSFFGGNASEEDTIECIYEFFEEFNYPLDTHTGAVMHVARLYARGLEEQNEKGKDAEARPMIVAATESPYKFPQAVYYALTGNDVKDSFKGVKRINLITAMKVPESLKALRYKPLRFKTVVSAEKIFDEVMNFIG